MNLLMVIGSTYITRSYTCTTIEMNFVSILPWSHACFVLYFVARDMYFHWPVYNMSTWSWCVGPNVCLERTTWDKYTYVG